MSKAAKKPGEGESETYADSTTKLEVTQPQGFAVKVCMRGKVDLAPNDVFDLLTHPQNHKIFRGIEAVLDRKVLHDKGGKQKVLMVQEARWKFLFFSGKFATHLHVEQDRRAGTVKFSLAKAGMMKDFAGFFSVQPYSRQALDAGNVDSSPRSEKPWWAGGKFDFPGVPRLGRQADKEAACLCRLEQSILPNITPPRPLDRLMKGKDGRNVCAGIAVKQVRGLMDDLRQEVTRIRAGKATLDTEAGRRFKAALEEGSGRGRPSAAPAASISSQYLPSAIVSSNNKSLFQLCSLAMDWP